MTPYGLAEGLDVAYNNGINLLVDECLVPSVNDHMSLLKKTSDLNGMTLDYSNGIM